MIEGRAHLDRIEEMISKGENLEDCSKELQLLAGRIGDLNFRLSLLRTASGEKVVVDWPLTACMSQEDALGQDHFNHDNVMRFLGYRTGKTGATTDERRAILNYLYLGELPSVRSEAYMLEWGEPMTSKRLCKLAYSICRAMEYGKEKSGKNHLGVAIREWKDDLKWLEREFYNRSHEGSFKWPVV